MTKEQFENGMLQLRDLLSPEDRQAAGVVRLCYQFKRACKACGEMLYFLPLRNTGKPHPFNAAGSSHFATCPDAAKFRPLEGRPTAKDTQVDLFDKAPFPG